MASEACELEETTVAEELEDTPCFADDELCETFEEDCAVAELDTADELEEATEDELGTEALDAGVSFLAMPATANSGA